MLKRDGRDRVAKRGEGIGKKRPRKGDFLNKGLHYAGTLKRLPKLPGKESGGEEERTPSNEALARKTQMLHKEGVYRGKST